jgi:uncharacterized protein YeaO (DUF488 family)
MVIRIKRAYELPGSADGTRYLIDRLWPRGVSAAALRLTAWRKHLAPSDALRRWYRHDPSKFAEFRMRYRRELLARPKELEALWLEASEGTVTLVYGARDAQWSNAAVLAELLSERGTGRGKPASGGRDRRPRGV